MLKTRTNIFIGSNYECEGIISCEHRTSSYSVFAGDDRSASVKDGNGIQISMYIYLSRSQSRRIVGVVIPQVIARKSDNHICGTFVQHRRHQ